MDTATTDPPDRPPDRITYSDWEPDPSSKRTVERLVPVEGSLLRGFTYERRYHTEFTVWQRRRVEWWDEPERVVPAAYDAEGNFIDLDAPLIETLGPSTLRGDVDFDALDIRSRTIPKRTISRWHWEYKDKQA